MGFSGGGAVTGYEYFGSFGIAICHGPVKRLFSVWNGDTQIWPAVGDPSIDISSADGDGKTVLTTTIGTINFYWGTPDQLEDVLLASMSIDLGSGNAEVPVGNLKDVCYAVCQDVAFGGQVTPPTLTFNLERESSGLELSAHNIDGDSIVPEIIYDLFTNETYGAGLATSAVQTSDFVDAAETIIDEGLGVSPDIDQTESVRDLVGKLMAYIDGFVYFNGGKLRLALNRLVDSDGVPELDESDLLDEPEPANDQFNSTWNKTVASFTDRENKWETSSEPYDDPANASIVGESVIKQFDFPWITKRDVAKIVAKRVGVKGGLPNVLWDLKVLPSYKTLKPGDRFRLSYAKFGITSQLMMVKSVDRGKPGSPDVSLTVQEDHERDVANDYVPSADTFVVPGTVDENGTGDFDLTPGIPHLSWLPSALKGADTDGMLVAYPRSSAMATSAKAWFSWNPGTVEYGVIATAAAFPAHGNLLRWHRVRTTNWLLRVEFANAWDYDYIKQLHDTSFECFLVVGEREWKTVGSTTNQEQVDVPWLKLTTGGVFDILDDTTIDIEVTGAQFGTDDLLLETLGANSRSPTLHIYFGKKTDFIIKPTTAIYFETAGPNGHLDTLLVRYIKVTTANWKTEENIADVTASTYDRDDLTQCPNGTMSNSWGARIKSGYEFFDEQVGLTVNNETAVDYGLAEDLDTALGAIFDGTASADETLLAEHIDDVIGAMAGSDQRFYNS